MAILERIYTIPLGDAYLRVRNKRAKRAIAFVRAFALRHMKASSVNISQGTNSLVFRDGMQKPPRRIKVRIVRAEDGLTKVWLIGEEEKIKAEEEKRKKETPKQAPKKEEKKEEKAAENKASTSPAKAPATAQAPNTAANKPVEQKPTVAAKPSAQSATSQPKPKPAATSQPQPAATTNAKK